MFPVHTTYELSRSTIGLHSATRKHWLTPNYSDDDDVGSGGGVDDDDDGCGGDDDDGSDDADNIGW